MVGDVSGPKQIVVGPIAQSALDLHRPRPELSDLEMLKISNLQFSLVGLGIDVDRFLLLLFLNYRS